MLIFVIPSSYPNSKNVLANIFVHEQCLALKKQGCEIVVLDATSYRFQYWLDKSCCRIVKDTYDDIPVYRKHIRSILTTKLQRLSVFQSHHTVTALFNEAVKDFGMPDMIYAHFTYPAGYVSCKIARKYNIPLTVMEHGGIFMQPKVPSYLKKILTKTVESADLFACVSEAQRKCLYRCSESKKEIAIINNMINDIFTYHTLEKKEPFTVFSAGNLYKVKRMDNLVEGFIRAFGAAENVTLRIAGEGAERTKIEEIIAKHGREKQIVLLGRLSREKVLEEFRGCHVFALVSEHESFGIAYREALAVGRPVISSDNGGINTGWKDEFGKIVPVGDTDALCDGLKDIRDGYGRYNLEQISADCVNSYSSKSVAERLVSEFERLIKNKA